MGRAFEVRKNAMAKTAGQKTKVYSKYGKEIYVCAKNGGADPDTNLSLRRLMEKAKKDQVPSHVIEKAIDKAAGGAGEDSRKIGCENSGVGRKTDGKARHGRASRRCAGIGAEAPPRRYAVGRCTEGQEHGTDRFCWQGCDV